MSPKYSPQRKGSVVGTCFPTKWNVPGSAPETFSTVIWLGSLTIQVVASVTSAFRCVVARPIFALESSSGCTAVVFAAVPVGVTVGVK